MFTLDELIKVSDARVMGRENNSRLKGISLDSRTIKSGQAFLAIKGDRFDGHDFIAEAVKRGARAVILQRPESVPHKPKGAAFLIVRDTIKALADIAGFQRNRFSIPLVAVTGSCGKTTTKEMLAWVLSKKFRVLKNEGTKNNHIGLPLTLLGLNSAVDIAVLEIGTNHFGEVACLAKIAQPNIGLITNIGPAHLENFKDISGVLREKCTLLKYLKRPRIAVLNADDALLRKAGSREEEGGFILGFGIKGHSDFLALRVKRFSNRLEFVVNPGRGINIVLNSLGYCNIYNALAAITVARIFGMDYQVIASALADFNFEQGRLNFMESNKIKFINDSYNSNPLSLKEALDTLNNFPAKGRKIFVMGDMLELGSKKELFHRRAGQQAAWACDIFVTVGRLSKFAASAARLCGFSARNLFSCSSPQEARELLFRRIAVRSDDIVLVKGSRAMRMEEVLKKE